MKRIISILLAAMLISSLPLGAFAEEAKGTTLRLAAFEGTVTMENASGKSVTPRKDMRLYNGYTAATAKESSAYISLDGTKAVKLDASGKVRVQKSGKQLEVYLVSGQLFFNVEAPLEADESLNIRSGTMVTGVRGSFGWVTSTEMGLMHGHVTLTCTNPDTGETRVTEVYSGEMVYFEQDTTVTAADDDLLEIDFVKQPITNEDVPAIVVEEMREDEALQEQVTADVETVDVPTLLGSLEEKKAEESAAVKEAEAVLAEAQTVQEEAIAESESAGTDFYYEGTSGAANTNTSAATYDDSGDSGSDAGSASTSITTATTDTDTLQSLLNSYNSVTLTATGSFGSVNIPTTSALTIASGVTYTNTGTLTNNGTIYNYSADTLINNGTFYNYGTLNNGDGGSRAGRFVNNNVFRNYGPLNNPSGSRIDNANGTIYNYTGGSISGEGSLAGNAPVTVSSGSETTDSGNVDRGLGVYEFYLTGATAGDYYASISTSLGIDSSSGGDNGFYLWVQGNFSAFDATDYPTLKIRLAPFSGKSFPDKDAADSHLYAFARYSLDGNTGNVIDATVTQEKWTTNEIVLSITNPMYQKTNEYANMTVSITLADGTSGSGQSFNIYLSGTSRSGGGGESYTTANLSEALAALSDSGINEVRYTGSEALRVDTGATMALNKSLYLSNADLSIAGTLNVASGGYLRARRDLTVEDGGTLTLSSGGDAYVYDGGSAVVASGGTVTVDGSTSSFVAYGLTVAARGSVTATNGGHIQINGASSNAGTITVTDGNLLYRGDFAAVNTSTGTITVNRNTGSTGYVGYLDLMGVTLRNSGRITGTGTYYLSEYQTSLDYDDGTAYVTVSGTETPSNYYRRAFTSDPGTTATATYVMGSFVNEDGSTFDLSESASGSSGNVGSLPDLVGKNGYNITFSIVENFLNATLSGAGGGTRAVAYSDEEGPWSVYPHVADGSSMGLFLVDDLALTSNRYITRVYVYDSSDGGWNSDNPIAGWMLDTPIHTDVGSAAFPHSSVSVTETAPSAGGTDYVYTFTGLDFNNYSYLLIYTPPAGSDEVGLYLLTPTPNADTFSYATRQSTFDIYAVSTKLIGEGTDNAYYLITRTKPITVTVGG